MVALSFYSLTASVRSAAYRLESVTLFLTVKLKILLGNFMFLCYVWPIHPLPISLGQLSAFKHLNYV